MNLVRSAVIGAVLILTVSRASAETDLFVLRIDPPRQGIFRYDPAGGSAKPFALFGYNPYRSRNFQLTAVGDRIIVQGTNFYEFDAVSGQLLRSYPAFSPEYNTWAFNGVAVDEQMADELGIAPGFYGFPICPGSSGTTGYACDGPVVFPGYPGPVGCCIDTRYHILLRRPLDPHDTTLSLAGVLDLPAEGLHVRRRFPAIDLSRRGFWFWTNGSGSLPGGPSIWTQELTFAPIAGGLIGEEISVGKTILESTAPREAFRESWAFTYHHGLDSFFQLFYHEGINEVRVTRQWLTGEEQILDRSRYIMSSVTGPAPIPPRNYTQVLPGIAHTRGKNGTEWRSDAWFFNPSGQEMAVTVQRVTRPSVSHQLTIPARGSIKLADVLPHFGGGSTGDGTAIDALTITSPYRAGTQLSVYSRTYTPANTGGTYGHAVPAVPSAIGYSNHRPDHVFGFDLTSTRSLLILDKRNPSQFRHNLGVVNNDHRPLTVRLRYAIAIPNPHPDAQRDIQMVVPPNSVEIYPLESLFPPRITDLKPPWIWVIAERPAVLWLSMVDNRSGDATFVPFTLMGLGADQSQRLAIPMIKHTGADGLIWRTDLHGEFPGLSSASPHPLASFYPVAGTDCPQRLHFSLTSAPGAPVTDAFPWDSRWYTAFPDAGRQACSSGEVRGALEVQTGSWMAAFSRTYATRPDGGTFGEMLPFYPPRGWPSRHFTGLELGSASSVSVGLYNGLETTTTLDLRAYSSDGALAATTRLTLEARASLEEEVEQLFGTDLADGLYGLTVEPVDGSSCWAYITIRDRITGDPTIWW